MPYDDEDPPYVEPDPALTELTGVVIGAAFAVYRELGPGLDEALYHAAVCHELKLRGVSFEKELIIAVHYKGTEIGRKRLDLLVADRLVVELKAVESRSRLHSAQLLTYLKITGRKLGLLINFNTAILKDGIKRVINPRGA